MAEVIMPKMGDAMEEGTLLKWLKSPGDEVAEGDPIAEIETDKVTLEIEAAEAGFLTNTLVEEGETVPIGTAVATIGAEDEIGKGGPAATASGPAVEERPAAEPSGDEAAQGTGEAVHGAEPPGEAAASADVAAGESGHGAEEGEQPVADEATAKREEARTTTQRAEGERLRASPLVKRLAAEHEIDLNQVTGTGPGGRIVKADIADFVSGAKPAPRADRAMAADGQEEPARPAPSAAPAQAPARGNAVEMSRMKERTGVRMAESKREIPHFYVSTVVDMGAAMDFRQQSNASLADSGGRLSVNDLVIKAVALALVDNPTINRSFVDGELLQHDAVDINMAVAVDGGLIAPFIPAADQKSLGSISRIAKDLGRRTREGGLKPEEYQGGTFTISNLGMFDVDEFIAVINPPQAAILAVASVREVPVVKDGRVVPGQQMKITLAADHRALDGAEVAVFLQSVKHYLEHPMLLALS